MQHITIANREIPLELNMLAMEGIEEAFGDIGSMMTRLGDKGRIGALIELITVLGNAGLSARGKEADLTHEWVGAHLSPAECRGIDKLISDVLNEGMRMQTEEDKPRDLVLEKIEKKDEAGA